MISLIGLYLKLNTKRNTYNNMEKTIEGLKQILGYHEKTTKFKNGYIKLSNFGSDLARCIFQ